MQERKEMSKVNDIFQTEWFRVKHLIIKWVEGEKRQVMQNV